MTGKSGHGGAGAAEWLAAMQMELIEEVEATIRALPQARPGADADSAALDRHARAIVNLARAAKAAASLAEPPARGRREAAGEDMSKKADDIDPEDLARVCEDIVARYGRLAAAYERKRLEDGVSAGGAFEAASGAGADPGRRAA